MMLFCNLFMERPSYFYHCEILRAKSNSDASNILVQILGHYSVFAATQV